MSGTISRRVAGRIVARLPLPPLTAHRTLHREGWNQWNQWKSDNLLNLKWTGKPGSDQTVIKITLGALFFNRNCFRQLSLLIHSSIVVSLFGNT